jgi:hypothetical protein
MLCLKLPALAHTALKIGSKYSFTPRKLRRFVDFCLVWPSLADFSDKAKCNKVVAALPWSRQRLDSNYVNNTMRNQLMCTKQAMRFQG